MSEAGDEGDERSECSNISYERGGGRAGGISGDSGSNESRTICVSFSAVVDAPWVLEAACSSSTWPSCSGCLGESRDFF